MEKQKLTALRDSLTDIINAENREEENEMILGAIFSDLAETYEEAKPILEKILKDQNN